MSNKHRYGKALIVYDKDPAGIAVKPENSNPDSKTKYNDENLQPNKGGPLSQIGDFFTGADDSADKGSSWKVIEWDCVMKENHKAGNEITKYPVQTGFVVSDHTIRQNRILQIRGIIVNVSLMPKGVDFAIDLAAKAGGALIGSGAGAVVGSVITKAKNVFSDSGSSGNRVQEVFEELQQLCLKGTIVHVSTILGPYINCVIRSVEVTQDVNSSSILVADMVIEELQVKGELASYTETIRKTLAEDSKVQFQWGEYAKSLGLNTAVLVGGVFGGI